MLKSLFVLEIFIFCPNFLLMQKKVLKRNVYIISKRMMPQTGQQNNYDKHIVQYLKKQTQPEN